jgi:hypothetical protein
MASLAQAGQWLADAYPRLRKYSAWNQLLMRSQEWYPPRRPIGVMTHVPKTGGTALRNWIRDQRGMWEIPSQRFDLSVGPPEGDYVLYTGHMRCDFPEKSGLFSAKDLSDTFTFLMVRNPYHRVVSLFFHFVRHGNFQRTFFDFLQVLGGAREEVSDRSAQRIWAMGKPMVSWLGDSEPENLTILRYEEFDQACMALRERMALVGKPEVIGRAPSTHNKRLVGSREEALIQSIYREDFDRFDYGLTPPTVLRATSTSKE